MVTPAVRTRTSTSPTVGAASCTLYGYPGVSLVSGPPYTQIGLAAKRGTTTPVKLVTLAPGATAHAVLQIVDALNFPPSSCGPAKATYLRIYPPNQKAPGLRPHRRARLRQAHPDPLRQPGSARPVTSGPHLGVEADRPGGPWRR